MTLLLLLACGRPDLCPDVSALEDPGDVLAVGDSVLAWGKESCTAVPERAALERGAQIRNASIGGTRVLDTASDQEPIAAQVEPGDWAWVILDGGGNDMNGGCGCSEACAEDLDRIVDAAGDEGEMPALVDELVADGARVLLLGYYPMADDAWYGFDSCGSWLDQLDARYEELAAARQQVDFLDLDSVIDPQSTPEAYDFDGVHPSVAGGELLGRAVAERLADSE